MGKQQIGVVCTVLMVEIDDPGNVQNGKKEEVNEPIQTGRGFESGQSA